ncbi:YokU family protein [Halalkalibacter nanhaiisediminis]|uniref:Putative YokU family protein n=1 Tax=Halalkalibacter nanhaiisediminis TaxID=688079 RepID=A0A562QSJ4_9BACI|nr:YokU family protein [Halalkalibacter nanhaiisediminis]TWI59056.1 putative YokU family protein [Halalkalibacter nanhaiisediminis]
MRCEWCGEQGAKEVSSTVYWELPDGSRAIEIKETPGVKCDLCGMEYQAENTIQSLEDQLLLIDTLKIGSSTTFKILMKQPRLLKRNYFRYD